MQFPDTAPSKKQKRVYPPSDPSTSRTTVTSGVSSRHSPSSPFHGTAMAASAPLLSTNINSFPSSPTTSQFPPAAPSPPCQDPPPSSRTLHFYLLHPCTPSPTRVLIPLTPTSTLASSLQNRVVLEFPTIYALRYAPEELPTGFFTQEEYFRNTGGPMSTGLVEATLHHEPVAPAAADHKVFASEGLDAGRLLDVLKQDLGVEVMV